MKQIPLRDRDGEAEAFALVDDHDFEFLALYNWHRMAGGYAARTTARPERRLVYMHRQIVGLQPGECDEVDHANRNKLDNRRANLRVTTHFGNAQNQGSRRNKTSRYRGVSRHGDGRWTVRVCAHGKTRYLGLFDDEVGAARVAAEFYATELGDDRDLRALGGAS